MGLLWHIVLPKHEIFGVDVSVRGWSVLVVVGMMLLCW
jgi:hypothetical protein